MSRMEGFPLEDPKNSKSEKKKKALKRDLEKIESLFKRGQKFERELEKLAEMIEAMAEGEGIKTPLKYVYDDKYDPKKKEEVFSVAYEHVTTSNHCLSLAVSFLGDICDYVYLTIILFGNKRALKIVKDKFTEIGDYRDYGMDRSIDVLNAKENLSYLDKLFRLILPKSKDLLKKMNSVKLKVSNFSKETKKELLNLRKDLPKI